MRRARHRRTAGARWLWSALALVVLLLVGLYLSLPWLIQHLLPRWLNDQGVVLQMEAVEHDILGARLVLRGVRAGGDDPVLSADEIVLSLDLSRLLSADLRLDKVHLLRGDMAVSRDGTHWRVAGHGHVAPEQVNFVQAQVRAE